MTDRRCSGCSGSGGYGVVRANGVGTCGRVLTSSSTGRCGGGGGGKTAATVRPAVMHVRKTWKNAAVMLFAVAAVTTATAAFYFNYAATACCTMAVAGGQSFAPPDQLAQSAPGNVASGAAAADEPNRGLFGSSVARASKMYAVCETHDYRQGVGRRNAFRRDRRQAQATVDSTSGSTSGGNGAETDDNAVAAARNAQPNDTAAAPPALIYFITPTYPRREQVAELTRLGQTLMHVPRLYWIVADDRPDCSRQIMSLLPDFSIPYTYIASPMPAIYKRNTDAMPRGVANRRAAINWIRLNHNVTDTNAVIYFGDDDNTFHLDLFKEIRTTKKISMFPVGLVGEYGVSSPIIDKGKVIGFFDSWPAKRKFPVDMAGFALNVQLLFKYPLATMPYKAGFEEDRFLSSLDVRLEEIEPKADNCTRILVWHTQTAKKPKPIVMVKSRSTLPGSLATLLDQVALLGIGEVSETTGVRSYMTKNGNIFRV